MNVKNYFPEKNRQMLFDVGMALIIPAILAAGYYFWSGGEDAALLSLSVQQEETGKYGVKAKEALAALRSIQMDASIFEDPIFTSLNEFTVEIDESIPLGRTYPFTPPQSLRNLRPATPAR